MVEGERKMHKDFIGNAGRLVILLDDPVDVLHGRTLLNSAASHETSVPTETTELTNSANTNATE